MPPFRIGPPSSTTAPIMQLGTVEQMELELVGYPNPGEILKKMWKNPGEKRLGK